MGPLKTYTPRHFAIDELVDKETMDRGEQVALWCLDPRLLWTLDALRSSFGPATCNDWKWGGRWQYRGFRPDSCPVGAVLSQHRFGRAADLTFRNITAEEIRADMQKNPTRDAYQYIGGVELDVSWLHIDIRSGNDIRFFTP